MTHTHYEELKKQVDDLDNDLIKFGNGNHAAGTRVRKQLATIKRTCQAMRNSIQEQRSERKKLKH